MKEMTIKQHMYKEKNTIYIWVPIAMLFLKVMYMASVDLMLPEMYNLWSFNKSVDWLLVTFELPVFFTVLYVYMRTLKTGSLYGSISTMFFIVYFIPNNSGLSLSGYEPLYYFSVNFFSLALIGVLGLMVRKEIKTSDDPYDYIKTWQNKKMVFKARIMLVIVCAITITYVYLYHGIDFSYFTRAMYGARAEHASFAEEIQGSLISYIILVITMAGQWFLMAAIYHSIMAKKPVDTLLCLFTYLVLFTVDMQKGTLAVLVIVIFVAWHEMRGRLDKISFSIIKAFVVLFIFVIVENILFGTSSLFGITASRMFYIPAYMTYNFYEFFSTTSKIWFTSDVFLVSNILSNLFGRIHPSYMIGLIRDNAFSGLLPSPNTGLFAEAYAQMGILGIVVYPFIFAKFIKIMGEGAKWYGKGVAFVIILRLSITLINQQILVSRTVVGIVFFYLISYMFFKRKKINIMGDIVKW